MFEPSLYAFASVGIISVISLIGAATLPLRGVALNRFLFVMVSVAVGALFGDAVIHLIPETFELIPDATQASLYILAGVLGFFVLEKFLLWHHHHDAEDEHTDPVEIRDESGKIRPLGYLVLASDGVHNFVDGMIIAAAYLVSVEVGIATTIAIALHEVPHEFADFALLIHAGFSRARALVMNFISALTALVGAAVVFFIGNVDQTIIPIAIAFGAGNFLYIAGSDLVPELHKHRGAGNALAQFFFILVGIALMLALLLFE